MRHPSRLIVLLERELLNFASDNNAQAILRKYSISLEEEKMQKALVIWSTEFRHVLERWRASLPDDAVEAEAFLERKKGPRTKSKSEKAADVEVIEDIDL